ncbi:MAG TPA: bifunctional 5,10-methylenetetrahydrofolate dehydrogenase/5,10-methenyltetrahydrofolate cyclohydrolase [Planctomycetota bacterium]|nr:bifunctional 5,10-methylenetetrahydrofolate dehydrogenase/5,10-methenyltetrahydrofolate cyclohydrolase [Planctomycetota bacterium]HRR81247.1 bifunctional 5,10-methylenetetrahydrofolate dehydrogenase/5,10-methenyltetrahydrofolate cyclohydrolase [Planctomycetota bacterium]HRT94664.1 bifunctional 5,10-methylenetetrahydrofolate dehydrogenase/5,10-methenyltetrahydrofolate cyclohydrolase [Planctomycetota bacterium]
MSATIIDGEAIAARLKERLAREVEHLKSIGKAPHLVALQANDNAGSRIYVASQKKSCEEIGIRYDVDEQPLTSTQAQLAQRIAELNAMKDVTGIIIQMPLPEGCDSRLLQEQISPTKDAEGMCPANLGRVVLACSQPALARRGTPDNYDEWLKSSLTWNMPAPAPCTAVGSVELIRSTGIDLYGKHAVVVGHSEIVGKPVVLLLLAHFCTVSCAHIATPNLAEITRQADILVVATGKPQGVWNGYSARLKKWQKDPSKAKKPPLPDLSALIKADMIKPGAVVIDVAINRLPKALDANGEPVLNAKGKPDMVTCGDVDFEAAKEVAGWITPVPGGVGPMTTALLLRNVVEAAKLSG